MLMPYAHGDRHRTALLVRKAIVLFLNLKLTTLYKILITVLLRLDLYNYS